MQSLIGQLDERVSLLPFWAVILIYMGVLLVIAVLALWKKWLTKGGLLGAVTLGFMVLYLGGFSAFTLFLFFFVSCSILSKIKRFYNSREKKGSQRDLMQVLANGLPAVVALLLTRTASFRITAIIGFSAAVAEAVADTFSSTFGIMSRKDPVSIMTFTRVPKGISGGVTMLGLLSGAGGAVITALLHCLVIAPDWHQGLIISGTGFIASVIDSVLGATVQEHFRTLDGTLTEHEYDGDVKNVRVRGLPGFDNDMVNLTSGFLALSLSLLLASVTVR